MFTLLVAGIVGYTSYLYGKRQGEQEMYQLCRNAEQTKREFFSRISLN
jgi:hypothetical protein